MMYSIVCIAQGIDYLNLIMMVDRKSKNYGNAIIFGYFLLRNYLHFGI